MQRKEGPAVTETMTFAGLDVHARSTYAAAIDVQSGGCDELASVRAARLSSPG
jgi:hypothetical protein